MACVSLPYNIAFVIYEADNVHFMCREILVIVGRGIYFNKKNIKHVSSSFPSGGMNIVQMHNAQTLEA